MELSLNSVSKQYKDKLAVNALSLTMHNGIYGLLGPNGSGKTTLMRMICTVLRPSGGSISLDGEDIIGLGESYRDVLGYLPQDFGYYPNFTGRDFLMYFAALKGLTKYQAEEKCGELLELTGLSEVAGKKLKTYSGGMRQRIGIAQALINDPKILVLDEPTSGLDPAERAKFRNIIGGLSKNRIILLSTHIVSDIEYIADRIVLMKNGEVSLEGAAESICGSICVSVHGRRSRAHRPCSAVRSRTRAQNRRAYPIVKARPARYGSGKNMCRNALHSACLERHGDKRGGILLHPLRRGGLRRILAVVYRHLLSVSVDDRAGDHS